MVGKVSQKVSRTNMWPGESAADLRVKARWSGGWTLLSIYTKLHGIKIRQTMWWLAGIMREVFYMCLFLSIFLYFVSSIALFYEDNQSIHIIIDRLSKLCKLRTKRSIAFTSWYFDGLRDVNQVICDSGSLCELSDR